MTELAARVTEIKQTNAKPPKRNLQALEIVCWPRCQRKDRFIDTNEMIIL